MAWRQPPMPASCRTWSRALSVCLALLLPAGCAMHPAAMLRDIDHPLVGKLWDVARQSFIDEAELMRRAAQAEALLLGETHDNLAHHLLQGRILQARLATGARPALLMEQFDVDQQGALDAARRTDGNLEPLMRGWDWRLYEPLITLANTARIPLLAANLSRNMVRPIVREGYSALPAGELQRLALDLVWDGARQQYMARLIEESHCGKVAPPMRDGLISAQRLRDAAQADVALGKIDTGVVFIIGRGHARRDVGVPRYLEARRPGTRVLTIGFVEVSGKDTHPTQYEEERVGGIAAYDIIWFTPRAERGDPCIAIGN